MKCRGACRRAGSRGKVRKAGAKRGHDLLPTLGRHVEAREQRHGLQRITARTGTEDTQMHVTCGQALHFEVADSPAIPLLAYLPHPDWIQDARSPYTLHAVQPGSRRGHPHLPFACNCTPSGRVPLARLLHPTSAARGIVTIGRFCRQISAEVVTPSCWRLEGRFGMPSTTSKA